MARTKVPYTKEAKSLDEQIAILRSRNVIINDEEKAKEYLADIGYYRLGFYSFPFELTYPYLDSRRQHNVRPVTTIEEIVALYYYDFDLRSILNRYLSRIEVSIRTTMIYKLSLKYKPNSTWFVSPTVVKHDFITDFYQEVYRHLRSKPTITSHHNKYFGHYAPAWKTMEYMTMGNLETLYDNLLLDNDKKIISNTYGEASTAAFKTYLSAIREVRNACAHGNVLYGLRLSFGISTGAACPSMAPGTNQSLHGALRVIDYLIRKISVNRANDMWQDLFTATKRLYGKVPTLRPLIEANTGIILPEEPKSCWIKKKLKIFWSK